MSEDRSQKLRVIDHPLIDLVSEIKEVAPILKVDAWTSLRKLGLLPLPISLRTVCEAAASVCVEIGSSPTKNIWIAVSSCRLAASNLEMESFMLDHRFCCPLSSDL